MQYRFDLRAFLLAIGLVIASAVTLYAVHRVQQPRNARNLLAQSEADEQEGRLDHAIRALDRYLTLNPADTSRRYHYGELLERIAEGGLTRFLAIDVYQKVLEQDSKRLDARQKIAILLCESGQWDQAMKHLQILWNDYRNEADPAAFVRLADCSYRIKEPQPDLSRKVIETLINDNHFPNNIRAQAYVVQAKHRSTKRNVGFKLSENELSELKKTLPESVFKKVAKLKRDEVSKNEFVSRVDEILTDDELKAFKEHELKAFKEDILRHADVEGLIASDLKTAKALAPGEPDVIIAVAEQDLRNNKRKEAREELTFGRDHHPKNQRFYLALAQLDLEEGHSGSAIAELRSGLTALPEHTDLLVELINQLCEAGGKEKIEEAKSLFDSARKNKKQRMTSYDDQFLNARLEAADNKWAEATPHFEALLRTTSPQSGRAFLIYRLLCQHATEVGDTYKRIELLDKQIKSLEGSPVLTFDPTMRFDYAVALVESGKVAQAIAQFQELVKGDKPDLRALLALARWEAIQVLERKNSGANPDWTAVDNLLARLPGKFKLTKESLGKLKESIPDVLWQKLKDSSKLIDEEFTSRDRLGSAISTILGEKDGKKYQKVIVDHAVGQLDLMAVIAEAEIYATRGESEKEREQKRKAAQETLEKLCNDEEAQKLPELWMARIHLESDPRHPEHTDRLLNDAKKFLGNDPSIHMMEIYLAAQLPREAAITSVKSTTTDLDALIHEKKYLDSLPPGKVALARKKVAQVWELAATFFLYLKGTDEQTLATQELAFEAARKVVDFAPSKLQSYLLLFETAIRVGPKGNEAAKHAIFKIQTLEGSNGGIANYCEALRSILFVTDNRSDREKSESQKPEKERREQQTKQVEDALKKAHEELTVAQAHRPNWSKLSVLWAKWYTLKGDQKNATEKYWMAYNQGDRSFEVIAPLIAACLAQERFQEAVDLIPQDKPVLSLTELRMFSEVYLQAVRYELALKAAQKAAELKTATADEHLLLALVYAKQDDNAHAKEWLEKACKVADSPAPWVARIQFLLACKPEERKAALLEAEDILSELKRLEAPDTKPAESTGSSKEPAADKTRRMSPVVVKVAVAKCTEVLHPGDAADNAYKEVGEVKPSDPDYSKCVHALAAYYLRKSRYPDAEKLIQPVINEQQVGTLKPADVKELRRQYAIIMANSGNFQRCNEALTQLEKNTEDSKKEDRLDTLTRAAVLAKKPGGKRVAIGLYEALQKESPLPIEAKFIYAQLCIITGNTVKGYGLMDEVVKQSNFNPAYTIYWVNILLEDDELNHAKSLVADLLKSGNADSWQLIELQAQLNHAFGKTVEAAKLVANFKPNNQAELLAAARRLEEYKDFEKAKAILINNKDKDEDQDGSSYMVGLAYAGLLARQGDVDGSLTECDYLIKIGKLPTPLIVGMAVDFLGYIEAKPKEQRDKFAAAYQRLEKWLEKALSDNRDPAAVFVLADLYDHKGDYNNAIKVYRQLQSRLPDNSLVLYRLARLILLQNDAKDEAAKEAETLLASAIGKSGPQTYLNELLAIARLRQNRIADAIDDLRHMRIEQPTANGHFLYAVALRLDAINKKDKLGGEAAFQQSLKELQESTPRSSRTLFELTGDAVNALQNSSEFASFQKFATSLNKGPTDVQKFLKEPVGKKLSREAFEKTITESFSKEEDRLGVMTKDQKIFQERAQQLQTLIMNYAGFNTNALHPLEEKAFQNLRSKAFEVESKSVSISP